LSPLSQLHSITNHLLQLDGQDLGGIHRATNELHNFLTQNIEPGNSKADVRTVLDKGTALNTEEAARCIKDFLRTKRFIDGIAAAVKDRQQQFPGKPIRILYAGTGPFATLLLPLTALLSATEMKWVLLEAHRHSYDHLQTTIATFGLQDYVEAMHYTDATNWQIPAGMHFDIIVSETMQCALMNEPQVAIWMNLLPQLNDDCIVIPQQVVLTLAWIDITKRLKKKIGELFPDAEIIYPLGTAFDLCRETIIANKEKDFSPVKINVDPHPSAALYILTDIIVYRDHVLKMDESGLTLPFPIKIFPLITTGVEINCRYILGSQPRLVVGSTQSPVNSRQPK
jgi:hypothetical protein